MLDLRTLVTDNSDLKQFIEDEAGHPAEAIEIWSGMDFSRDEHNIKVFCRSCERKWLMAIPARMGLEGPEYVGNKVMAFFRQVSKSLCFRFSLAAELAEWITERVAAGGAEGVKYSSLLDEATKEHLCSPKDVDAIIIRLGFKVEFPGSHFTARVQDPADLGPTVMDVAYVGGVYIHDGTVRLPHDHPLAIQRRSSAA